VLENPPYSPDLASCESNVPEIKNLLESASVFYGLNVFSAIYWQYWKHYECLEAWDKR